MRTGKEGYNFSSFQIQKYTSCYLPNGNIFSVYLHKFYTLLTKLEIKNIFTWLGAVSDEDNQKIEKSDRNVLRMQSVHKHSVKSSESYLSLTECQINALRDALKHALCWM